MNLFHLVGVVGGMTSTVILCILLVFEAVTGEPQLITFFRYGEGFIELGIFLTVIAGSISFIRHQANKVYRPDVLFLKRIKEDLKG